MRTQYGNAPFSKKKTQAIQQVYHILDRRLDDLTDLLAQLVRIPSVNPIFSESKNLGELKCQKLIGTWLQNLGYLTELWEPSPLKLEEKYKGEPGFVPGRLFDDRPNLSARLPGSGHAGGVLLTGHVDVVGASEKGWSHPPFEAVIKDGILYGRGAVDMKGGLVGMLGALAAIHWAGVDLAGDVWFASVVDEEAGGMGTLALADRLAREKPNLSAAIIGEPTNLKIAPLSRGILWGELQVTGKSGHVEVEQPHWSQGGAVDAIRKAIRLLSDLDFLNEQWARRPDKRHPLLPRPCSVRITQIEGGHSPTSYADCCRIVFNVQYLPSEQDELRRGTNVAKEIEDYIHRASKRDPWLVKHPPEIHWLIDADSYELDVNHPFVKTCQEAAKTAGVPGEIRGVETHTDAGRIGYLAGLPTVILGPGDMTLAHQVNEHVLVEQILLAAKIYAAAAILWVGV